MTASNPRPASGRPKPELVLEWVLFASRWIQAPLYVGMILVLGGVLIVFLHELATQLMHIWSMDGEQVILLALWGIDLSLTANLLLIVIFAGYENFVSKIHVGEYEDRPAWMGTVDFSALKLRLIAPIVAISAIALLRAFLPLGDVGARVDDTQLRWMVVIHLTFVTSGVLLAVMDWLNSRVASHEPARRAQGTVAAHDARVSRAQQD
jgi:uncharacterized protein (TIGR00645 family)